MDIIGSSFISLPGKLPARNFMQVIVIHKELPVKTQDQKGWKVLWRSQQGSLEAAAAGMPVTIRGPL